MINTRTKAIAAVTAAALALSTAGTVPAFAAGKPQTAAQVAGAAQATEFSAGRRYYRGGDAAAGAAVAAAIIGGIAAYAAAREYRKAQDRAYYAPSGYGYGPGPYYGPYRRW